MSLNAARDSPAAGSYRLAHVSPELHRAYALQFVGGNMALLLYGLSVSLFLKCVKSSIRALKKSNDASDTRPILLRLLYVSSLFASGTAFITADTWVNIFSTLEYPLYPGGPIGWVMDHYDHPIVITGNLSFLLAAWLSDAFMIYRCYVVYTNTRAHLFVAAFTVMLYLASLTTGVLLLTRTSQPHSWLFSNINFALACLSVMTSLHVTLTALISGRLLYHRIWMQSLMKSQVTALRVYTSISTMLIESSALYSAFVLMFMIPFAFDHPVAKLVLPLLAQIQVISPLLVVHRLTRGMGWTSTTSRSLATAISTMRFGDGNDSSTAASTSSGV